jgi:hypothetical protein
MTRPDWPAIEARPATRYGRDDEPRRPNQWRGIVRDALIGSLVLFAVLVASSAVPV